MDDMDRAGVTSFGGVVTPLRQGQMAKAPAHWVSIGEVTAAVVEKAHRLSEMQPVTPCRTGGQWQGTC